MANREVRRRVRALLRQNQKEALTLGAKIEAKYGGEVQPGIVDDTPPNLKKKAKKRGAFMNKKMRSIQLGRG